MIFIKINQVTQIYDKWQWRKQKIIETLEELLK